MCSVLVFRCRSLVSICAQTWCTNATDWSQYDQTSFLSSRYSPPYAQTGFPDGSLIPTGWEWWASVWETNLNRLRTVGRCKGASPVADDRRHIMGAQVSLVLQQSLYIGEGGVRYIYCIHIHIYTIHSPTCSQTLFQPCAHSSSH